MSALAQWLFEGVVYGTALFALAWLLSRWAPPSTRAVLFTLVLIKFVVPFGVSPFPSSTSAAEGFVQTSVSQIQFAVPPGGEATTPAFSWRDALLCLWAAGVVAIGARRIVKHRALLRRLGPAGAPGERVRALAAQLGVAAPRCVVAEGGPFLVGLVAPVLVLPAGASGAELDAMIVHELAHLRRRDPLWRALQALVETLFFFWPVVRLASRELSLAREQACDLAVLESGVIEHARYAEVLLQLGLQSEPSLAMAAQPSQLERRIQMVLSGTKRRSMWAAVLVVGGAGLAGASASVWSQPELAGEPTPIFTQPAPVQLKADGAIDEGAVQMQLITQRFRFDGCYLDYLRDHPGVSGTLVLHFAVKTDGTVDEGCQSSGTTLPIEIGRCVTERLKEMQFPMPNDLHDAQLEYRFDFVLPPSRT